VSCAGAGNGSRTTIRRLDAIASYTQLVMDTAASKRVHRIKSPAEIKAFLAKIEREVADS
jgi:hypothetical protein